jgi:hypothetical protein
VSAENDVGLGDASLESDTILCESTAGKTTLLFSYKLTKLNTNRTLCAKNHCATCGEDNNGENDNIIACRIHRATKTNSDMERW